MNNATDPKLKKRLLAAGFLLIGLFLVMVVARLFLTGPPPAATGATEVGSAVVAAAPGAEEAAAPGPASPARVSVFSLWGRMALVLLAIYGMFNGLHWLRERTGRGSATPETVAEPLLRVCDALSLGGGREIHLLEVGETRLLIGSLPGQLVSLGVLHAPSAPDLTPVPAPADFEERVAPPQRRERVRSAAPVAGRRGGGSLPEWEWEQRRARLIDALQNQSVGD